MRDVALFIASPSSVTHGIYSVHNTFYNVVCTEYIPWVTIPYILHYYNVVCTCTEYIPWVTDDVASHEQIQSN